MSGRGNRRYRRRDNGREVTDEDVYTMIMLHQYQRKTVGEIARRFSIDPIEARVLIGKRTGGSCCG